MPAKLAAKICKGEFIEMGELSEFWSTQEEGEYVVVRVLEDLRMAPELLHGSSINDHESQPGLRGPSLGVIRRGLQAALTRNKQ